MSSMDDQLEQLQRYLNAMHLDLQDAGNSIADPDMRRQIEDYAQQVTSAKQSLVADYRNEMANLDAKLKRVKESSEATLKRAEAAQREVEAADKKASKVSKDAQAADVKVKKDETLGPRIRKGILERYALQPAAEGTLKPHVSKSQAADWEDWFQSSWEG